ncbi:MAG: DUF58 domain-containing protein [Spirochaetales bacterium]|nr:DUF58 domain-containing protein [Spirochaetales bacterium]
MRKYLNIRWGAVLVYLFAISLIHLAWQYIGLLFGYLFFALLTLPIISLIHLLISMAGIKYHQTFDTDHPVKGQVLKYTLLFANESNLPSVPTMIQFRSIQPGSSNKIPDLYIALKRGERSEHTYEISCPFRGIYTVGLEQMEMSDILGWITIYRPVWHKTFYVYPRIVEASYPFSIGTTSDLNTGPNPGASQDYSLFENLVQYRQGQSIRHIAWKKFISLGEPFLKSYGKTSQPGVSFYLDLRRSERPTLKVLEREDCSIEILVALVKYCLDRSIPVSVSAMGQSRYEFTGSSPSDFPDFHRDTVNILFHDSISPAELYKSDMQGSVLPASVVFITHLLDQNILAILEDSVSAPMGIETKIAAIMNQTGMDMQSKEGHGHFFDSIIEKGGKVVMIEEAEEI